MGFPQSVLIVDDDPIQRAVLKQIFATRGSVVVKAAADGLDAISLIEHSGNVFDLIILDLLMPQYDGISLISYLESQNIKARILFVSGMPDEIIRMSNTLAEVGGLRTIGRLQKPIRLEDLIAIISGQVWPSKRALRFKPDGLMQISHA